MIFFIQPLQCFHQMPTIPKISNDVNHSHLSKICSKKISAQHVKTHTHTKKHLTQPIPWVWGGTICLMTNGRRHLLPEKWADEDLLCCFRWDLLIMYSVKIPSDPPCVPGAEHSLHAVRIGPAVHSRRWIRGQGLLWDIWRLTFKALDEIHHQLCLAEITSVMKACAGFPFLKGQFTQNTSADDH